MEKTMDMAVPEHKLGFYPFWIRPDGKKSLLTTNEYLVAKKIETDSGFFFRIIVPVQNISARAVTFRVRLSDESKYKFEPEIGILESGHCVDICVTTKGINAWSYPEIHYDSMHILATTFTMDGLLPSKDSVEKTLAAVEAFWQQLGTVKFPSAEEHVLANMLPFDDSYVDLACLDKCIHNSIVEKNKQFFYLTKPKAFELKRKRSNKHMKMLFDQFSKDPGDLFIRDQVRSLLIKRDRMKQLGIEAVNNQKNIVVVTGICVGSICLVMILFIMKWYGTFKPEPQLPEPSWSDYYKISNLF